jgi:lysophospholipase L1-like esterase
VITAALIVAEPSGAPAAAFAALAAATGGDARWLFAGDAQALTNGVLAGGWPDVRGAGHLTAAIEGAAPVVQASPRDGARVVVFDGATQGLKTPVLPGLTMRGTFTLIVIASGLGEGDMAAVMDDVTGGALLSVKTAPNAARGFGGYGLATGSAVRLPGAPYWYETEGGLQAGTGFHYNSPLDCHKSAKRRVFFVSQSGVDGETIHFHCPPQIEVTRSGVPAADGPNPFLRIGRGGFGELYARPGGVTTEPNADEYRFVGVVAGTLSDAEKRSVVLYARDTHQAAHETEWLVVAVGDSLTNNENNDAADGWFQVLMARLGLWTQEVWNVGRGGQSANHYVAQNRRDAEQIIEAHGAGRKVLVLFFYGSNDIVVDGRTAVELRSDAESILASLTVSAALVGAALLVRAVMTLISRDAGPTWETQRQIYNGYARSGLAGQDVLIDVAADDRVGAPTAYSEGYTSGGGAIFNADGTHLLPGGNIIVANICEPVVRTAMGF